MRRAARKDGNETRLRKFWERLGGSWLAIAPIEGGEPDALLGFANRQRLAELKDPDQPPNKQKLRANQVEWHTKWRGEPVSVVLTETDLMRIAQEMLQS